MRRVPHMLEAVHRRNNDNVRCNHALINWPTKGSLNEFYFNSMTCIESRHKTKHKVICEDPVTSSHMILIFIKHPPPIHKPLKQANLVSINPSHNGSYIPAHALSHEALQRTCYH